MAHSRHENGRQACRDFKIRHVFVGVLIVALPVCGGRLLDEMEAEPDPAGEMSSGFGEVPDH